MSCGESSEVSIQLKFIPSAEGVVPRGELLPFKLRCAISEGASDFGFDAIIIVLGGV
jgi:hypothetical protein